MILSRSFLLGVALLAASDLAVDRLPAPPTVGPLLASMALLPVPSLLARWSGRRLARAAILGWQLGRAMRLWVRLESLSVPLAYAVMLFAANLEDFARATAPQSDALHTTVLLLPLLLLEGSFRMAQAHTNSWFAVRSLLPPHPLAATWGRGSALMAAALVGAAAVLDVAGHDRHVAVFLSSTYVGNTASLLFAIAVLSVVLAPLLILALSTDRRLPSGLDGLVRDTCHSLGFPPSAVRVMRSGGRLVTAALVGPLPWPRYLLLTDGLLAVLDPFALRGVVAHEVGHARARHPGLLLLLFVVVPVLAIHPLASLDLESLGPENLAIGGLVALALGWWLVRRVMHQMEFEADHLSAEALGGAMPTITALERVGDVHGTRGDRATFRHPSGRARIEALLAWERDPGYRDRFARRSRRLRRAIAVVLVTAVTLNAWSLWRTWDVDRVYLAFLTGDFAQATERLEALPDDAPGFADRERTELAETLSAARELVDGGGPWERIGPELARDAWRRGLDELARSGPAEASRWFDLSTLGPAPGITRQLTQRWSRAARDGERDEEARVARHLSGLPGLPPELRAALDRNRSADDGAVESRRGQ